MKLRSDYTEAEHCGFCQKMNELAARYPGRSDSENYYAAVDALFDQADRARRLRRAYGKKHRR